MASHNNVIKAAAAAALAWHGGTIVLPECPSRPLAKYHNPHVCLTKPSSQSRPVKGHIERKSIYETLLASGTGASLVPNTQTVTCPLEVVVQSLEDPSAVKGFDTTWIVENTSTKNVVVARIVDGIEYSPFHYPGGLKPMEDPKTILKPGDWISIPTFESFVYHVREINGDGALGNVVLQHRTGMIPIGNPRDSSLCDGNDIDAEPFSSEPIASETAALMQPPPPHQQVGRRETLDRPCTTSISDIGVRNQVGCPQSVYGANNNLADNGPDDGSSRGEKYKFHNNNNNNMGTKAVAPQESFSPETLAQPPQKQEVGRGETLDRRQCNIVDVSFRNQVGCPLSVYWANNLADVPDQGFTCGEMYKFHMGTKAAPQDFMWDWNSMTKYEGSFIGHTFVARLASDPSVIIDKYTLEPTRIIDCPTQKQQQVMIVASNADEEAESESEGTDTSILSGTTTGNDDNNNLIQEDNLIASGGVDALLATAGFFGMSGKRIS